MSPGLGLATRVVGPGLGATLGTALCVWGLGTKEPCLGTPTTILVGQNLRKNTKKQWKTWKKQASEVEQIPKVGNKMNKMLHLKQLNDFNVIVYWASVADISPRFQDIWVKDLDQVAVNSQWPPCPHLPGAWMASHPLLLGQIPNYVLAKWGKTVVSNEGQPFEHQLSRSLSTVMRSVAALNISTQRLKSVRTLLEKLTSWPVVLALTCLAYVFAENQPIQTQIIRCVNMRKPTNESLQCIFCNSRSL